MFRRHAREGARLRINSWLLPAITIILAVFEILEPGAVSQALLVALGGAWLVGYLWARSLYFNVGIERAMRFGWVQVGDQLEEELVLFNDGWLPATWAEVIDQSTLPGYSVSRATGVEGASENTWRTSGTCTRRGVYQLGGTLICTGDPLGIYRVEIEQPESAALMVMPPVIPLPSIEVAPGGWLGEGRPRPDAPEKTVSAASVREYLAGDSLRLVHWPTTARRNELYVRLLEGAPAGDWWVALDFDAAAQAGTDESDSTAELGVILAASLADQGLRNHRSVGLLANSDPPLWIRPQPGEHRRWEILRALAMLEPGRTSLAHLLQSAGPSLGRQASLVIITPSMDSDWLRPLLHLYWRGIIPTVILIDPSTFGAATEAGAMGQVLTENGIAQHVVTRDLLRRPEARPGERGRWDWHISTTGKAVARRTPGDMAWRRLS
jgi:uncharacterized protein (DUF58 family)